MRTLVLALALASISAAQPKPVTAFDPAGKWTYSTQDENGNAISGIMEITGARGAYAGTITTSGEDPFQINEVLTSSTGMIVLATLPSGPVAFVKVSQGADGKIQSSWGPLPAMIPATLARAK